MLDFPHLRQQGVSTPCGEVAFRYQLRQGVEPTPVESSPNPLESTIIAYPPQVLDCLLIV